MIDYKSILNNGTTIVSSGTTGIPKKIFRSPENLLEVNKVAIEAQKISKKSSILTVTNLSHAGGLLAQTLPALSIGSNVEIKKFNPFTFLKDLSNHTHTFLTPEQMEALSNTKNFSTYDFNKKIILGGSNKLSWNLIEKFVKRNAVVVPNWGMSEIGPICINSFIEDIDTLNEFKKQAPDNYTLLGDRYYCDWKIIDNQLYVKGPTCIYNDWYATKDIVTLDMNKRMFYYGRL